MKERIDKLTKLDKKLLYDKRQHMQKGKSTADMRKLFLTHRVKENQIHNM